jgi:hypothetical protein
MLDITATSKNNTFTGNSFSGFGSTAMAFDATSINNNQTGNTVDPTHITTALNDVSGTNTPTTAGMVKIAQQTLGSAAATVTFSSIPATYKNLKLVVNARSSSANVSAVMQFNGDTATNYDWQQLYGSASTPGTTGAFGVNSIILSNISGTGATAGAAGSLECTIPDYAGTTFWKNAMTVGGYQFSSSALFALNNAGTWHSTAAINSILLQIGGGGNFLAGSTFTLYGMN